MFASLKGSKQCKIFSADLVNEKGNIPRKGVVPKFSDLEVISLSLAAESIGIDSENFLFSKLNEHKDHFSSLISRRQYNDRRKLTIGLCNQVRERIASNIDSESFFFSQLQEYKG